MSESADLQIPIGNACLLTNLSYQKLITACHVYTPSIALMAAKRYGPLAYTQFTLPHQTRQNSPVCVLSASAVWTGFPTTQDCRRQEVWSQNTLIAIVQFTAPRQARYRQDCLVVSGVAVWTESARPADRCVLCRICVGVRRAVALPPQRMPARQLGLAASHRYAKCKHAVGMTTAAHD